MKQAEEQKTRSLRMLYMLQQKIKQLQKHHKQSRSGNAQPEKQVFLLTLSYFLFFGLSPLSEKGYCNITSVSMSVGKRVSSKMAHRIFLKLLMKLVCFKSKKLMELYFLRKKSHFRDNAQKHPKRGFFEFCKKIVH